MTSAREPDDLDPRRFDALVRGHAVMQLTDAEQTQLRALAAGDPGRRRAVADFDELHRRFAQERALMAAVAAPGEPVEEVDEGFARLAAAAARAEDELRSRLLHAAGALPAPRRRLLRFGLAVAALAAAVVLAFAFGPWSPPPRLHDSVPGDERAGGVVASIMMAPHLSAADRSLEWSPVWHARTYEVAVLDADGKVVLQRSPEQARSTRWDLTSQQVDTLRTRRELRLRVRALDGTGLLVGASGDLPLQVQ